MKQLSFAFLKECSYIEVSLYRPHVSSGFAGRTGNNMDVNHVFPWGGLAVITLVRVGLQDGGPKSRARCEVGPPLFSVAIMNLSRAKSDSNCWNRNPEGQL